MLAAAFAGAVVDAEGDPAFPAFAVAAPVDGRASTSRSVRRAAHAAPPEGSAER